VTTSEPASGTGVLEQTRLDPIVNPTDDGDHERLSHYVPKDRLMDAMVNGTPVIALCGKVWVPTRDPERFPVCPECKEIWESLGHGQGGQGDGGKGGQGGEGGPA
jgi:hypothetical protein